MSWLRAAKGESGSTPPDARLGAALAAIGCLLRGRGGREFAVAIMRALVAALMRRPGVLLLTARSLPLGALCVGRRVCRRLRRRLASPVAIPVAIVMLMMVAPVMVTVMPLPLLSLTGGRLILLLLPLRLALFARRRSIWLTVPVVMRPMPALTTPLTAWTAMMAPFALAFRAVQLGFRSTETPDFLEFRLGGFGGGAICRLWGCSVRRHPRRLPWDSATAETSAAAGPSSTAAIAGASALA